MSIQKGSREIGGRRDVHDMKIMEFLSKVKNAAKRKRLAKIAGSGDVQVLSEYRLADIDSLRERNCDDYLLAKERIEAYAKNQLKAKAKVKVAFVLYSASMWSCADLYRYFKSDEKFQPYVVVCKYTNESNTAAWPTYHASIAYFEENGYDVKLVEDSTPKDKGWQAMGEPDIVFYLTPYHTLLPVGVNQGYLPAKVLTVYIPYSYMLIRAEQKYEVPGFRYSWRHYCDSEVYRELLLAYDPMYERNTVFVGYPKMDIFFAPVAACADTLWKSAQSGKKRIIYAPHHSLKDLTYCASHFATFDKNGQFILELAKKYQEETSWIIKPHPNLKKTVLMAGVFQNEQEYYDYLGQWDALPNAKVVKEGTYFDYFKTSDAMICDSVSFLAEYQFTGKPLLLLTRPEQDFNAFGQQVQDVLYKCEGQDFEGIEEFITKVVIGGRDPMAPERAEFFDGKLNFYEKNGRITASEKIYKEIREAVIS